jgi:two-component system sensor histidine kinase KdpD
MDDRSERPPGAEAAVSPNRRPARPDESPRTAVRERRRRGRLHVFLGAAPGVGKTFAMLDEGLRLADDGFEVLVGVIETHDRPDLIARLGGLEVVSRRRVSYRGVTLEEMDLDALLRRSPAVVLVDELAHSDAPGCRFEKRWQDVEELLAAGIDVVTNLNVQHLESLNDAVEMLTGFAQRETVPDAFVAGAERIELLDVDPQVLRSRIAEGAVFAHGEESSALAGFFSREHLIALRELALGWLEGRDRVEASAHGRARPARPALPPGRVVAALTGEAEGEHVIRRAAQLAAASGAELVGVHVRSPSAHVGGPPVWLERQQRLLLELGGRYAEVAAVDVATAVLDFVRSEQAHQLVLGATRRSRGSEFWHGSVINRAIGSAGAIEVHVIPARRPSKVLVPSDIGQPPPRRRVSLPARRRAAAWVMALLAPAVLALALLPMRSSLGIAGELFGMLLAVVLVAVIGGWRPAMASVVAGFLLADFLYTRPYYSLRVGQLVDIVALVVFAVVAVVIGALVDILTRQGVQVARARAEATGLARLLAERLASDGEALAEAASALRAIFDLDSVALLRPAGGRWEIEEAVGAPIPQKPEQAQFTIELADRRLLAINGSRLEEEDAELLQAFLTAVRQTRERAQARQLAAPGPAGAVQRSVSQPTGTDAAEGT